MQRPCPPSRNLTAKRSILRPLEIPLTRGTVRRTPSPTTTSLTETQRRFRWSRSVPEYKLPLKDGSVLYDALMDQFPGIQLTNETKNYVKKKLGKPNQIPPNSNVKALHMTFRYVISYEHVLIKMFHSNIRVEWIPVVTKTAIVLHALFGDPVYKSSPIYIQKTISALVVRLQSGVTLRRRCMLVK